MDVQISLPLDLKDRIEREAAARGISVPDFLRLALERAIIEDRSRDPLFTDTATFGDDGPDDVASNHDDYLYGNAS